MRHNKKFNHLSRQKGHRDSMLANMTISLILHKRIFTTLAKAKALRVYAEPLINRAKEDTMTNRRVVFSYLQNKEAVKILFQEIAEKIAQRPGGYTRILKTGNRLGDNAKTCFIELVDYNEAMLKDKTETKAKTAAAVVKTQLPQLLPRIPLQKLRLRSPNFPQLNKEIHKSRYARRLHSSPGLFFFAFRVTVTR